MFFILFFGFRQTNLPIYQTEHKQDKFKFSTHFYYAGWDMRQIGQFYQFYSQLKDNK